MHKHYNYLQSLLRHKLLTKVINNAKLEGLELNDLETY